MSFSELRILFELLCDHLEADTSASPLQFEGGYGFEFPLGVVMVFVFQEMVVVCRFSKGSQELVETARREANPYLDMINTVHNWKGDFSGLFR